MRSVQLKQWVSLVTVVALVATTSHYLAHFHSPAPHLLVLAGYPLPTHPAGDRCKDSHAGAHEHATTERCGLCLQLDRLPATPVVQIAPRPLWVLLGWAPRLPAAQRVGLFATYLPQARAPPRSTIV